MTTRTTKPEQRVFAVQELRVLRAEGAPPRIAGHAAVFNTLSEDLWGFREQIAPGAFAKSLGKDDIRALWNHDPNIVLGRNRSGTLSLAEDERGLAIEIVTPDTQLVRDMVLSPIERGDVSQMSFGFRTISDEWRMQDGMPLRTLLEVDLFDVSPVTFPAYPDTDVAVRSLEAWRQEPESEVARAARADLDLRRRRLRITEIESGLTAGPAPR